MMMRTARLIGSVADIRRKLRAVAALAENAGATEHERATAAALKARLQQQLNESGEPAGDWTDNAFRFGKRIKELRSAVSPTSPKGDWTDNAFRLGKALRRGYKKWL
jgi:phage gp16-like protein